MWLKGLIAFFGHRLVAGAVDDSGFVGLVFPRAMITLDLTICYTSLTGRETTGSSLFQPCLRGGYYCEFGVVSARGECNPAGRRKTPRAENLTACSKKMIWRATSCGGGRCNPIWVRRGLEKAVAP
jgi:hypothetical protein